MKTNFSDLKSRALSALVLVVVCGFALVLGGWIAGLMITLFYALLLNEWFAIWWNINKHTRVAVAFVIAFSTWGAVHGLTPILTMALATVLTLAITLISHRSRQKQDTRHRIWFLLGLLYISLFPYPSWHFFAKSNALLHEIPWAGLYLLSLVIAADVGAYFAGKTFQGAKILPSISPNKTWSGLFGALGACFLVLIAWDFTSLVALFTRYPGPGVNAGIIALMTVAGDMFQSYLKRRANVKDTGAILPGHGGLFDRLDGFIGASALVWINALII